jgi:FkbM family methyltransferase
MSKYYGQIFNGMPVDQFLHQKYFSDKTNGFFIECGAADGLNLSCCKFFEESMGWKGINVEASPTKYAKLIQNRPDSFLNINKGLLNESGVYVFRDDTVDDPRYAPGWGNGSFEHTEKHFGQLNQMGIQLQESEVTTITFKELIEQNGVENVDLFILDVEGVEPLVIEGMKGSNVLPKHVFIEHEHVGLDVCKELMAEMGYVCDWNDFCNSMYILK